MITSLIKKDIICVTVTPSRLSFAATTMDKGRHAPHRLQNNGKQKQLSTRGFRSNRVLFKSMMCEVLFLVICILCPPNVWFWAYLQCGCWMSRVWRSVWHRHLTATLVHSPLHKAEYMVIFHDLLLELHSSILKKQTIFINLSPKYRVKRYIPTQDEVLKINVSAHTCTPTPG